MLDPVAGMAAQGRNRCGDRLFCMLCQRGTHGIALGVSQVAHRVVAALADRPKTVDREPQTPEGVVRETGQTVPDIRLQGRQGCHQRGLIDLPDCGGGGETDRSQPLPPPLVRPEERPGGTEWASTCNTRWEAHK